MIHLFQTFNVTNDFGGTLSIFCFDVIPLLTRVPQDDQFKATLRSKDTIDDLTDMITRDFSAGTTECDVSTVMIMAVVVVTTISDRLVIG